MVDKNYKKIEVGQKAIVRNFGHFLKVEIYEIEKNKVYFRTISPKIGEPTNGYFNRTECQYHLTII